MVGTDSVPTSGIATYAEGKFGKAVDLNKALEQRVEIPVKFENALENVGGI